jgi:hypothetical protein
MILTIYINKSSDIIQEKIPDIVQEVNKYGKIHIRRPSHGIYGAWRISYKVICGRNSLIYRVVDAHMNEEK